LTTETQKTFTGRVVIDDKSFVDCVFKDVTMVYFGGPPPSFQGCEFDGVGWEFKSSASNTVALLRAFAQPESGFRSLFERLLLPQPAPAES
jgi:hypothetical protein